MTIMIIIMIVIIIMMTIIVRTIRNAPLIYHNLSQLTPSDDEF